MLAHCKKSVGGFIENETYGIDISKTVTVKSTETKIPVKNVPKCPTCGSTNIRHITATERGVNAVMFGVFGTKRKCQFECQNPNCKYRW